MLSTPIATIKRRHDPYYINLLKNGDENGLAHFYKRLYPAFSHRAFRSVKDDVAANSIAQEAFLRLWLLRSKMDSIDEIIAFLKKQTKQGVSDFYTKSSARFHRGMIKLDDIENYQDFLGGFNPEDELDLSDLIYQDGLDAESLEQMKTIEKVLPNLEQNQQLFIKLCLKYSFSYDRIAWHLGGISDYEVARKVEKTLANLKEIIINANKLNLTTRSKRFLFEGQLNDEQANILNMRYDLNFSFEEIADQLGMSIAYVQTVFVQAYSAIKKNKSITKRNGNHGK